MQAFKLIYMLMPVIISVWLIVLAQEGHAQGIKGFFSKTLPTVLGVIGIIHWMDMIGWF